MNRLLPSLCIGALLASCGSPDATQNADSATPAVPMQYPTTAKTNAARDYHGTQVSDPYAWLEDDQSAETASWVDAQNKVTYGYLHNLPGRETLAKRYEQMLNYEKVGQPYKVGEYYFLYKNSGLQNQSVIYYRKGLGGEDQVFIDPNTLSEDGTTSINLSGASKDHKHMVISRSEAGSDWTELEVIDIATNTPTGDLIKFTKFGGASWYKDGFFYSRYPEPEAGAELSASNEFHMVYYHKLGTPQGKDKLVYRDDANPNHYHWASVTEDERYVVLYKSTGTDGFETHFKRTDNLDGPWNTLQSGFANKTTVVGAVDSGDTFLVVTDVDAPKYRMVKTSASNPTPSMWTEVIPEREHLLEGVSQAGGKLIATYLENACNAVYMMNEDGSGVTPLELPDGTGSAGGFGGNKDDRFVYYSFSSFTYPNSVYELNLQTGESNLFYAPELAFDPSEFESRQVFYTSKDGTQVPVFLVHKRGLEMDGKRPTLLYGYGGFNVSLSPSFSVSNLLLLEQGGVYALANLRGGGEYGEEWHQAGMLDRKQNVFDDFIACAEGVIAAGITDSDHLAIRGGSNGGLLVGACMTQRPELFQVAFPAVGVMDMLKYHEFTVGHGWIPEYGCADSSKTEFDYLCAYSPYHNITPGTAYPATMVTTADHDDRVVPAHSFKFAARLQEYHNGDAPVLIRIEKDAGHGAGKPTSKVIEEISDMWAFMFANMGVTIN